MDENEGAKIPPDLLLLVLDDRRPDGPPAWDWDRICRLHGVTIDQIAAAIEFKKHHFLAVYPAVAAKEHADAAQDGRLDGVFNFLKWLAKECYECPSGHTPESYIRMFNRIVGNGRKSLGRKLKRQADAAASRWDSEPGSVSRSLNGELRRSPVWDKFSDWVKKRWTLLYKNRIKKVSIERLAEIHETTQYEIRTTLDEQEEQVRWHISDFVNECLAQGYELPDEFENLTNT